jgi:hypothetical protein
MSAAFDYVIVVHGSAGCKRGRFAIVFVLRYPFIRVFEYSAFRKVLPELPDTYAKWQAELKHKKRPENAVPMWALVFHSRNTMLK